jgi:phospholipid/cholesterol/gamma-HCH transport system permease protein
MAAEIGVMRISEQLDALEVMDIDPLRFLIAPRLAACLIIFPLMTSIFNTAGIIGGFIAGGVILDSNSGIYFYRVQASVGVDDVLMSLVKSLVFGLIVGTVSCYKGYFIHMRTDGAGSAAVNSATTSAVVLSCILVLMSDYIITSLMR